MNGQMRKMGETGQLVTFRLGQEIFGIDIFKIQEVIHLQKINSIPNSPEFVEGVIKFRNQVIPVINMKKRMGICGNGGDKQRIVILDLDNQILGIIVDDISKVLQLETENYEDLPDIVIRDMEKACITRLAKTDDELIIIISPEQILTKREIRELKNFDEGCEQEPIHVASSRKQVKSDKRKVMNGKKQVKKPMISAERRENE